VARALIILVSISICVIDLRSHRIPNLLTVLLAVLLLIDPQPSSIIAALPVLFIALLVGYLGKIGAGDLKLFLTLLLTSTSIVLNTRYFLGMALVSGILVVASLILRGSRGKMIAFAPALLLPFLDLYLAI
jgi:Flp pilus assembly protein protease CpaA